MKRVAMSLLLILAGVSIALAQLPTGTILGTVKDSSGAVVAGASMSVRNTDTGLTRTTMSAADGSYRFDALPVGNYEVRAENTGFKEEVRSGLTLTVAEEAVVDFSLEVGASTQQVQVTAEAPIVNTTNGSLGGLVDEQHMADLPLNGRNYIQLALLQNGISEMKDRVTTQTVLGSQGDYFSSNGAPPRSNSYLLDGTSLVTYGGASGSSISGSTLGLDGIKEFRIVTNNFSAEYGMNMGSQMVMASKSGTNSFHGDAFDFLRNSAMDARNFFDTPTSAGTTLSGQQRRLPPFRRNNFGGAFGGPIKKDKTFFYAVYEGLRQTMGTTNRNGTIPLGCRASAGTTITNTACPQLGSTASVTIAPVVAPWIPLFPNPDIGTNQLSFSFNQPTTEDYGQIRIDQTISASNSIFGRYTIDNTTEELPSLYPGAPQAPSSRAQFLTIAENHIFSPSLLNTARFSASRTIFGIGALQFQTGPGYSMVSGQPMGSISIGGVTTAGAITPGGTPTSLGLQDIFAYSDDLFYTKGRHSLKLGTLINQYQVHAANGTNTYGTMSFASLATFLQGIPTSWTAIEPGFINHKTVHYETLGFYAQDDFRVTPRLTLNLGLRYEFNTNIVEIHGYQAAIRDLIYDAEPTPGLMMKDPSYLNFSPRLGFAWDVMGDGKTSVRGGFADLYNIAGWVGIMHMAFREPPYETQITVSNPGSFTVPFTFPPSTSLSSRSASPYLYDMKQAHMLQYNLALQRQLPFQMALTLAYGASRGYNLTTFQEGNPTIPAGVPGTTAGGLETCVARAAGQVAPNLGQLNMIDGVANACFLGNEPRRNPNWGTFNDLIGSGTDGAGQSWYNSLQVGLEKRITHGLNFQSNFTWSKLLDTTQCQSNGDASLSGNCVAADPLNAMLDKGPAIFNIPFAWRFNVLYHFPQVKSNKFAEGILNGWWVSSILQFQSGYPFTASFSTSRSKSNVGGNIASVDRPDLLPGRNNDNITHGTSAGCLGVPAGQQLGIPTFYYDPCAFSIQPTGFLGNEGRNILEGPNFQTVDLSLVKDTKVSYLGEAGSIEFRAEAFNILNRANFALPTLNVFAGTGPATGDVEAPLTGVGSITSTVSSSRQIQLALKLIF